tara:strand:- start:229 stop:495 length:267 start_codon:yes stop_codon:yes gene_type:complete
MPRKININKYQGNTHYSVSVEDSYGTEHHLGYSSVLNEAFNKEIHKKAEKIWANEVKPKEDLLGNAIKSCIELDKKAGIISRNRDGLD